MPIIIVQEHKQSNDMPIINGAGIEADQGCAHHHGAGTEEEQGHAHHHVAGTEAEQGHAHHHGEGKEEEHAHHHGSRTKDMPIIMEQEPKQNKHMRTDMRKGQTFLRTRLNDDEISTLSMVSS